MAEFVWDLLGGKEQRIGIGGTFVVEGREHSFVGSDLAAVREPSSLERWIKVEGLPARTFSRCAVELYLNEAGNLRVRRGSGVRKGPYLPANDVFVWGQDHRGSEGAVWAREQIVAKQPGAELSEAVWSRFDGGSIAVDIREFIGEGRERQAVFIRLNNTGIVHSDSPEETKWEFRVEEVGPNDADLNARGPERPRHRV